MELSIPAKDKKKGMSFEELVRAIASAEAQGLKGRPKVKVGFSSQIQELRFNDNQEQ